MKTPKPYLLFVLILLFFVGLYVYSTKRIETFFGLSESTKEKTCPAILVQEGSTILLFDPKLPKHDKNPIRFDSLEKYIEYTKEEKARGVNCPTLYLQQGTLDDVIDALHKTDGKNQLYTAENPGPVIDASRANPPYNLGNYAGFDPMNLFVGKYTELDKIHDSTKKGEISPNPLDTNWGGVQYTQHLIDTGVYVENNVSPPRLIEARYSGVII